MEGMSFMEDFYLVDFDNVNSRAISKCKSFTSSDHLYIYYSRKTANIRVEIINNHGASELNLIKVRAGNQAVDNRIIKDAQDLIDKYKLINIHIISNDKGYDKYILGWNSTTQAKCDRLAMLGTAGKKHQLNCELQSKLSISGFGVYANDIARRVWLYYGNPDFEKRLENDLKQDYAVTYEIVMDAVKQTF